MVRRAGGVETRSRKRLRSASRSPESTVSVSLTADELRMMDPRLMTERQQLAFLLRTTAQDASPSPSSSSGSDEDSDDRGGGWCSSSESSGEDEVRPRTLRRLRRAADRPSGRTARYRRRTRSAGDEPSATFYGTDKENQPSGDPQHADRSLHSSAALAMKSAEDAGWSPRASAKISADASPVATIRPSAVVDGPSPPSACALCCVHARILVDATAPLFLCVACDRKYPTQQALGRHPCAA